MKGIDDIDDIRDIHAVHDCQAIADRVKIEALRGEFTDAAMMRDRPRLASLFTPDGVLRMPNIPVEQVGREEILAGGERLQRQWDFFVQNTHPGTIVLDGDEASGRAYIQEIARTLNGRQGINPPSITTVTGVRTRAGGSPSGCTRSATWTRRRSRVRRPSPRPARRRPARRRRRMPASNGWRTRCGPTGSPPRSSRAPPQRGSASRS